MVPLVADCLLSLLLLVWFVHRLVFSQSLLSLDLIEAFLAHWDKQLSTTDDQVFVKPPTCSQIARHFARPKFITCSVI